MIQSLSYGAFNPSIEMRSKMYETQMRLARRSAADEKVAIELVIEYVHPGNLGDLPPSPAVLLYKARQIGLL